MSFFTFGFCFTLSATYFVNFSSLFKRSERTVTIIWRLLFFEGEEAVWGKLCVYLTHLRKKLHAHWPSQFEANNLSSTHDGRTHTRTHTHNKKHTRRQAGTGRQAGEGKDEMTMTKKTKKAIPKRSQRPRRRRGACCARLERSAHTKDPHASRSQPKPPDGVEDKH